jgi:broad specificity phosphatase PhoE
MHLRKKAETGLREWMGDLELNGYSSYRKNGMKNFSLFDWTPFLGGPIWREFCERVSLCMTKIESKTSTVNVMIVSHGGTVSNIVVWGLNLKIDALSERSPFTGKPGCISVLVKNDHDNRVFQKLKDTARLDGNLLEI